VDDALMHAFAEDVVFLRYAGLRPVVVHGGGPQITEQLARSGLESTFAGGLRVTTPEAMAVVDGEKIDIGRVGDVVKVDARLIIALLDDGRIPVVSSVARADDGGVYNVNADIAAAALAVGLEAEKLVVLTDVEGLYSSWPPEGQSDQVGAPGEVISQLTGDELEALLPGLSSGMAPKMEACLRAVRGGVRAAHVLDGRVEHSLLLEVFTDEGIGTMVVGS
jgi:acetylglutamate kinase